MTIRRAKRQTRAADWIEKMHRNRQRANAVRTVYEYDGLELAKGASIARISLGSASIVEN